MLNWSKSKEDTEIINKIAKRFIEFHISLGVSKENQIPKLDLMMDIEATHCNGNPLRLDDLLNADDFNFVHDLIGIQKNINRHTGQLENCFVPRYTAN